MFVGEPRGDLVLFERTYFMRAWRHSFAFGVYYPWWFCYPLLDSLFSVLLDF